MYVSYLETFCEKKIREKVTGKNYRGCNNPLGWRRVNSLMAGFRISIIIGYKLRSNKDVYYYNFSHL